MFLLDNWLRPIEDLILSIKNSDSKVIGITSPVTGSGVSTLARNLAGGLKYSNYNPLIIDLTKPVTPQKVNGLWVQSQVPVPGTLFSDQRIVDSIIASPSVGDRLRFNNSEHLNEVFSSYLETYDIILVDLPEIALSDKMSINPLAAAAACDSVMIVCTKDRTSYQDLVTIRGKLDAVRAKIHGIVLNEFKAAI